MTSPLSLRPRGRNSPSKKSKDSLSRRRYAARLSSRLRQQGSRMSIETFGLTISLISLALGLLSSWQQLRSLLFRAAKFGGKTARAWAQKEQALVELYLDHPAVLVAYLGKSCITVFLLFIALLFIRPTILQNHLGLSAGLAQAIFLSPACLIGLVLGAISSRCSDVIQLARKQKEKAAS